MTLRQSAACGWLFGCLALCVYAWTVYQMETQRPGESFEPTLRLGLYGVTFFFLVSAGLGYHRIQKLKIDCQTQTLNWGEVLHGKAMKVLNKRKQKLLFYALASASLLIIMLVFAHRITDDWQWMVMYTVGVLWVHSLVICFVVWKRLFATKKWIALENKNEETLAV